MIFWLFVIGFVVLSHFRRSAVDAIGRAAGGISPWVVLWGLNALSRGSRGGSWAAVAAWRRRRRLGWRRRFLRWRRIVRRRRSRRVMVRRLATPTTTKVSAAITAAEANSDGEIVAVATPISDPYHDVALHWAVAAMFLVLAWAAWRPTGSRGGTTR